MSKRTATSGTAGTAGVKPMLARFCARLSSRQLCAGTLVTALFAVFGGVAEPVDLLSTGNLNAFREPLGDWATTDEVALDPADVKRLLWSGAGVVAVNGEKGKTVHLLTVQEHGDARVALEFMVPQGSNSGVYLMGRYEIQILDSWGKTELKYSDCGGIYQRHDEATNSGFEGHAPRVNASKAPGEWQRLEIEFRAPRFDANGVKTEDARFVKVELNGETIHEDVPVTGPTRSGAFKDEQPLGPLMFQGNHGPVAYRSVRIFPATQP